MHPMDERFLAAVSRFEPNGHRKLGHFTSLTDFPEDAKTFLARAEEADRRHRRMRAGRVYQAVLRIRRLWQAVSGSSVRKVG